MRWIFKNREYQGNTGAGMEPDMKETSMQARQLAITENQPSTALVLLYVCYVHDVMCIDNVIVQRHG